MIFTSCTNCDHEKTIAYECSDYAGKCARWVCEKCQAVNFSELISFDGETLSEDAFWKKHPEAKKD